MNAVNETEDGRAKISAPTGWSWLRVQLGGKLFVYLRM